MSEQTSELEPPAPTPAPDENEPQPAVDEPDQGDGDGERSGDDELEARLAAEHDALHAGDGDRAGDAEQPPAAQQPSEKEVEETYKKLDNETARHVKRIAELVGDAFAYLVPCELCDPSMPGFRWPREPADDVKAAVRMAIGDRQPKVWQHDQYSRQCDACGGEGEVETGSKVNGQITLACIPCEGRGWQPIGDERRGGRAALAVLPTRPDVEPATTLLPADDPPEVAALKAQGYVVIKPSTGE